MKTIIHKTGFTLVELLMVIAIIVVLSSILMPVLSKAQEKARRATCMNNLGQFHRASMMYAMDYNDRFPATLTALERYLEDPEVYTCRSDKWRNMAETITNITAATADQHCSYSLVTRDKSGASTASSSPSRMVLVCDKNGGEGNPTATGFGGNHNAEGGHVVRVDGAVKWVNKADWKETVLGGADLASLVGY